ncbi:MAG: aldehyde dehydrogenase family protein, partial [Pseudomonadota bacterium]
RKFRLVPENDREIRPRTRLVKHKHRQMRMAKKLRAGQVFLNNYGAGGGVELPFGGSGLSGHGREKGFEALYGFTTVKTVAALHG